MQLQKVIKLSHQGNKFRVHQPDTHAELYLIAKQRTQLSQFKLKYLDGEDEVELENQQDYMAAIQYFNGRVFEVVVKPLNTVGKFYRAFFDENDCCKEQGCPLCKGTSQISLTESQIVKVEETIIRLLNAKFSTLQQIYKQRWGIDINTLDEFFEQHVILAKNGQLGTPSSVAQPSSKRTLHITPEEPQLQHPRLVSAQSVKCELETMLFGQESPKNSKSEPTTAIQMNDSVSISMAKLYPKSALSASFGAVECQSMYEPNSEVKLNIKIKNTGQFDWPAGVMLKSEDFRDNIEMQVAALKSGAEITVELKFKAKAEEATYIYELRLRHDKLPFGPKIEFQIDVQRNVEERKQLCFNQVEQILGGNRLSIKEYINAKFISNPKLTVDQLLGQALDDVNRNPEIFT